ncbi:uncharacterized protein LOC142340823 isoform X1 [Convolutriloba macropyga]|uniref:uncharacterized protein LOC142340823 isoform X1 n=1 Tax=Convolutriloba macropyga TaxID=536237 RepID=UPI003F520CA2
MISPILVLICIRVTFATSEFTNDITYGNDCWLMRTDTFNNSQYVCADERKCVPVNRICNKRNDCSDGSDEKQGCCDLDTGKDNGTHFACKTHMCIPIEQKCDGPMDCFNGQDELDCNDPAEKAANKNKQCDPPSFSEWSPSYEPNCSYVCGAGRGFQSSPFWYSRTCSAQKWDKMWHTCADITNQTELRKWCNEKISMTQIYVCPDYNPCLITEVSIKTDSSDVSQLSFGLWRDEDRSGSGFCEIGVLHNGDENEGVVAYDTSADCSQFSMIFEGVEEFMYARVTRVSGNEAFKWDHINITINNMMKTMYGGGEISSKQDSIDVEYQETFMLEPYWGEKEKPMIFN